MFFPVGPKDAVGPKDLHQLLLSCFQGTHIFESWAFVPSDCIFFMLFVDFFLCRTARAIWRGDGVFGPKLHLEGNDFVRSFTKTWTQNILHLLMCLWSIRAVEWICWRCVFRVQLMTFSGDSLPMFCKRLLRKVSRQFLVPLFAGLWMPTLFFTSSPMNCINRSSVTHVTHLKSWPASRLRFWDPSGPVIKRWSMILRKEWRVCWRLAIWGQALVLVPPDSNRQALSFWILIKSLLEYSAAVLRLAGKSVKICGQRMPLDKQNHER